MTVENQTPVKERIFADLLKHADARGRVSLSPEAVGKLHGLNGHDLAKNLDQLRKEGFIEVVWRDERMTKIKVRRGAANEARLNGHRKPQSVAERVRQWILRAPQQKDGWVVATPVQIREKLGIEGNAVSVAISDMQRQGEVEVRKEGMRITAVRMLPKEAPAQPTRNGATPEEVAAVASRTPAIRPYTMPATPELDKYLAAKRSFHLSPTDNPYITVDFTPSLLGEEALALKRELEEAMRGS